MNVGRRGLKTALAVLLGMGWSAGASPANAGRWVVIDADNAPLPLGARLENGQPVTLAKGARLTLLAEDGQTLKLVGPYAGVPGGGAPAGAAGNNLPVIAKFLQGHQQEIAALGGSRGAPSWESDAPPHADWIDADHSGQRCLGRDPVTLWRRDAASSESVTLADAEGQPLTHWTWPAGAARLTVAGGFFADNRRYRLLRGSRVVDWRVHKAPALPDQPAARAAWMADSGCKTQVLILLKGL